jgi:hypothetical protein
MIIDPTIAQTLRRKKAKMIAETTWQNAVAISMSVTRCTRPSRNPRNW